MRARRFANLWRHALLLAGAAFVVVPFLWMFTTSLQSRAETYTSTSLLPTSWHWENTSPRGRRRRSRSTT